MRRLLLVATTALGAALLAGGALAGVHEGTSADDRLIGSARADVIVGKGRHDLLRGRGGNDTLVGGAGRDRLSGGPGDDAIDSRDRARDTVRCGPGWDTVVADGNDVVGASCEHASFSIAGVTGDSGSKLTIDTSSVNNGGGVVHFLLEHPRQPLRDCAAAECVYPNLPTTATALISPEGGVGTEPDFGGDCAGTGIPPCRLSMNQDRTAKIIWNGSG
jgi:RTX calcium-binding nonapeptide repeat (4 copies)